MNTDRSTTSLALRGKYEAKMKYRSINCVGKSIIDEGQESASNKDVLDTLKELGESMVEKAYRKFNKCQSYLTNSGHK